MKKKLLYLFLTFFIVPSFAQKEDIPKLLEQLSNASSDSVKTSISIQLIKSYSSISLDSSDYYFQKAFNLAKSNRDTESIIKALGIIAFHHVDKGKYVEAESYLSKGLELGYELQDNLVICRTLIFQGNLKWELSNLKKALEIYQKALEYTDKENDLKSKAMILNSFGLIYGELNEKDKQLDYYNQSYKNFRQLKDTLNQALTLYNIADALFEANKFQEALEYVNRAIPLAFNRISRYPVLYESALALQGRSLISLGKEEEGFSILETALETANSNNNKRSQVVINTKKARYLFKIGNYKEAIQAALIAVKISDETGYLKELPELSRILADSYKAKKEFRSSLLWIEKEKIALQEIADRQKDKEILQLEANHELQKKETENQILLLKNKNQKTLTALLFALGLICMLFIYYSFWKKNQKKLEIFQQRIASDLHDEVGSNLNSITRIAKEIKSENNNSEINQGIDQLVKKSNTTIRNVVDVIWALDDDESKLEDLIEKMEAYLDGIKMTNKNLDVQFIKRNILEKTPLLINTKHHLLMVFKEAINNIQKHTHPTLIKVELDNRNQKLKMNITNHFSSKKNASNSTGKGIINIKRRINELGGTVEIKDLQDHFFVNIELDNIP